MDDQEQEELAYEHDAQYGDPRCCPYHPHVKTSSPCGMFDALCDECEYDGYEDEPINPEGDRGPNYEPDPIHDEEYKGPPVGTYAYTAWLMARCGIMDGDEADRWKDEMKEGY